jgi:beta-glucosidase
MRWRRTIGLATTGIAVVALATPAAAAPSVPYDGSATGCAGAPWMDRHRGADNRADLAIAQMTLDEKILWLGSLTDATHSRETPPLARLCLPALRLNNGSAGVSTGGPVQTPSTALPAPIGLAATWDPGLARRYGVVEGEETLTKGRNLLEGPDINIARVPTNGRTFEAYGEDPLLAGQMAVGDIQGIQSQGVIANVKHYAANNQETNRSTVDELIDERTLHEIYLPAFQAAVQQGHSGSVMCAKNQVNDAFSCENKELLTDILKGTPPPVRAPTWSGPSATGAPDARLASSLAWGFNGFVVSDFNSCHSTLNCANNGMDFELPTAKFFGDALKQAVLAGQVTEATLDDHVHRILATMIRFGIVDRPQTTSPIDATKGGAVSRQIAEQAAVLLKNDHATLPLDARTPTSVAVFGAYAGAAMSVFCVR